MDDIFTTNKLPLIDIENKTLLEASLMDEDGNEVSLDSVMTDFSNIQKSEVLLEQFYTGIYPFIYKFTLLFMSRIMDFKEAQKLLSNTNLKNNFTLFGSLCLILSKYIQDNGFTIIPGEKKLTDEEIKVYQIRTQNFIHSLEKLNESNGNSF